MNTILNSVFGGNEIVFFAFAIGLAFAVMVGGVLYILSVANEKRRVERRLSNIRDRSSGGLRAGSNIASVRRSTSDSSVEILDRLIKQALPNREQLRNRLMRTGYKWTIGDYLIGSAIVGVIAGALAFFLFAGNLFISICAMLFAGIGLPYFFIGYLGAKRRKKFVNQFPEGIDMIVRGIRSGLPISEAIGIVGTEMPDPIGQEFALMADNIRFGKTIEEAMWATAARLQAPEYDFFVVALSVQKETGGNLAETLENLSSVLRGRSQMKKKVKALAAEPKASAMILGALPFIMFGIIFMLNPDYVMTLSTDPRGTFVIGLGLLSEFLGVAIMVKLVNFEI